MKMISKQRRKEWLRRYEFALYFFGSLTFFALFASMEEILRKIGLN